MGRGCGCGSECVGNEWHLHLVMNEDFWWNFLFFTHWKSFYCLLTRRITVHLIQLAKVNIGGKNLFRNILERAPNDNISPKNLHSSLNVSHSFANTSCLSSFPLHHHSNFHSVPPHPPNVVPHDDTTPSSLPMSKTIAIYISNDISLTPSRHFPNLFLLSSNLNTHSILFSLFSLSLYS